MSLFTGILRDTRFIIGGVLLQNTLELLIEGFPSLIAAGHGVFRTAVFLYDFNIRQSEGRRILHNDIAVLIERELTPWRIIRARVSLDIRVGIGEIERADFARILGGVRIIVR